MKQITGAIALSLALLLTACGGPSQSPAQTAMNAEILAAECALYQAAYQRTLSQTGNDNSGIIAGCNGAPAGGSGIAHFSRAMATDDTEVKARWGSRGGELFRKMIARNTPVNIARQMTNTPEFARIVRLYQQYDAS